MKGVTLQTFEKLAGHGYGVITLDKRNEGRLINNKGTLGRAIVSVFKDVGEMLGIGDKTRARRRAEALNVFRQMLQSRYGEANANKALRYAGLDKAKRLDAHSARRALDAALSARYQSRVATSNQKQKFMTPKVGENPSDKFLSVLSSLKPPQTLENLSDQVRREYNLRLSYEVASLTGLGLKRLTDDRIQEVARRTLKDVLSMESRGVLSEARSVRNELSREWKGLLVAICRKSGPGDIVRHLTTIQQKARLGAKLESNADDDAGGDFFSEYMSSTFIKALRMMRSEHPEMMRKLMSRVLDDQGALKAVYLAAWDRMGDTVSSVSPTSIQFTNRMVCDIADMVKILTSTLGVHGDTLEKNELRMETDTVKPSLRKEALALFDQARLSQLNGVRDIVKSYVARYEGLQTDDGLPGWYSAEALEQFERDVWSKARQLGMDVAAVLGDLELALRSFDDASPELKERLVAAMNGMRAGFEMAGQLHDDPVFGALDPKDHWRLFMGGNPQNTPGAGKWMLEHNGQGTLAGMQNAFLDMLNQVRSNAPLDAQWLQRIQTIGSRNTFRNEELSNTYKDSLKQMDLDGTVAIDIRETARVPMGFRNSFTDLNLRRDTQLTPAGRQELLDLQKNDPWFERITETDVGFKLHFATKTADECRQRADQILALHENDMAQAQTDDDKIAIIARTTQALYRSHVFMDGNTRTTVFAAMNGLLVKAGLSPSILPEPKAAAGFSSKEFAQEIIKGQQAFKALARQQSPQEPPQDS